MKMKLKNIGMLKEADIKLDGLTIIAGENDTGKSTVGKALMAINLAHHQASVNLDKINFHEIRNHAFVNTTKLIFKDQMPSFNENESNITLSNNEKTIYEVDIGNGIYNYTSASILSTERACNSFIFIETPYIWDMVDFFTSIGFAQTQSNIFQQYTNLAYPFLLWEMHGLLLTPRQFTNKNIALVENIKKIIKGEVKRGNGAQYYFSRQDDKGFENSYSLCNVASGIKYFGIIQALLNNNYLNGDFIVIDEPENHLHPKWQLELAKLIVQLVKLDNKILVNSHSPYMIEALQKYSDIEGLKEKTNFYLAKDGVIKDECSLSAIFKQLAEPYDTFDKMDEEKLLNG